MKIIRILSITIISGFILIACENTEINTPEITVPETGCIKPVRTFGNQKNQQYFGGDIFIENEHAIYVADSDIGGYGSIARFDTTDLRNPKIIYKSQAERITKICVLGEWIYFVSWKTDSDTRLYRIKKNGIRKVELLSKTHLYVLTRNRIIYDQLDERDASEIGIMNLDGSNKRTILKGNYTLLGIDDGWMYYYVEKNDGHDSYLHRMRLDDSKEKNALSELDYGYDLIVDKEDAFFHDEAAKNSQLFKKPIGEKKTVLATGSLFTTINKEGSWVYYGDKNNVYMVKEDGNGEKRLLYSFKEAGDGGFVSSILLNNGDALCTSQGKKSVYIKEDGTIIELGQILQ